MPKKNVDYKAVLWKAAKEPLRLLVLAVIPVAAVYFNDLPYEWAAVAVVLLRLLDKFLHELGKEKDNRLVKGLTQF